MRLAGYCAISTSLLLLLACSGGGSGDGEADVFGAGDLAGTWLLSAEYSWQLEDASLSGRGSETMRSVLTIEANEPQQATLRTCYPGIAGQVVEIVDNRFDFRLFDAPVVFVISAEGVESPRIDFQSGNVVLPGPKNLRKVRADADIDSSSGEVALHGSARLLKLSDDIVTVTRATIEFDSESPVELDMQCFTEMSQRYLAGDSLVETRIHRVWAEGEQGDVLLEVDVAVSSDDDQSAATTSFADQRHQVELHNTGRLAENLFDVDGARLSFSLSMTGQGESATVEVQFDPELE